MLELLFNVYFAINIFLLGGYFLQPFNSDSLKKKIGVFFILYFFGGILVLWEFFVLKIKSDAKKIKRNKESHT